MGRFSPVEHSLLFSFGLQREMGGELFFPSAGECDGKATPARQVMIPTTFENLFHYRQVFKTALRGTYPF